MKRQDPRKLVEWGVHGYGDLVLTTVSAMRQGLVAANRDLKEQVERVAEGAGKSVPRRLEKLEAQLAECREERDKDRASLKEARAEKVQPETRLEAAQGREETLRRELAAAHEHLQELSAKAWELPAEEEGVAEGGNGQRSRGPKIADQGLSENELHLLRMLALEGTCPRPEEDQGNLPSFDQVRAGIKGLTLGGEISGSAALVALYCFFLPWVKLSGEAEIVASGFDLAVAPPSGASQGPSSLLSLAAPAMALAILAVIYAGLNGPRLDLRKKATWQMIMGAIGALPPISVFLAVHQARNDPQNLGLGYLISIEYGLWATLAGFIGTIVGALLDLKEPEAHDR